MADTVDVVAKQADASRRLLIHMVDVTGGLILE